MDAITRWVFDCWECGAEFPDLLHLQDHQQETGHHNDKNNRPKEKDRMKAQTAASLLRATRARLEEHGFVQIGSQEIYALQYAYEVTKNKLLLYLAGAAMKVVVAEQQTGIPAFPTAGKPEYEAIREGYKALEKLDVSATYQVDLEQFLKSIVEDQTEAKAAPQMPADFDKFATSIGMTEDELKKALDDKKDKPPDA